ncbi:TetR/AcrR family transcriptional regulator [Mycolicibacterium sp.]|uniref:TetR/AcrR family transcriptional regulator n=1 Tax=Mycolicibacterium sp. TaxID=2320850 RepID=UPI003D11BB6B
MTSASIEAPSRLTSTTPRGAAPKDPSPCRVREYNTAAEIKARAERRRLLTAAKLVLQRGGWWGFKVDSVLREARLSTRSFYRHFQKKNDLLVALLESELGAAAEVLERKTAAGDTPSARVRAYIHATLDMGCRTELAKKSFLFASHWRELLPEYSQTIDNCAVQMQAPLVAALTDGMQRGEFTCEDPVADAAAIFFMVGHIAADQAALGGTTSRAEVEHMVMPLITRGIGLH